MLESEIKNQVSKSETSYDSQKSPTLSRRTVMKGGVGLALGGGALALLKRLSDNNKQIPPSQPEIIQPTEEKRHVEDVTRTSHESINQDSEYQSADLTEDLLPPTPPLPPESEPIQPDIMQQRLQEERIALLEEPDPIFEQYLEQIAQETVTPPEQIPHRTMISKLGLNVLGGGHGDVILEDALLLNSHSFLYVGSCEPFLTEFTDEKHRYLRESRKLPVITRFNCVNNIVSEPEEHWPSFLHTLDVAKEYLGQGKEPSQLKEEGNLVIEIINEPNLYQSDIDPVIMANEFVHAAVEARNNGFKVLIPPMAPYTPPEWPHGDEMKYYSKFLNALKAHPHYTDITDSLELSVHSYLRHPQDNPLPRLRQIDEMVKDILKLDLPMHLTEFGLSRDFLASATELEKTMAVRFLLTLPLDPYEHTKIRTMNWWTPFADAPNPNPEYKDHPVEDYRPQSLRAEDGTITSMYKTIIHTIVQRGHDIKRIHEAEAEKRKRTF